MHDWYDSEVPQPPALREELIVSCSGVGVCEKRLRSRRSPAVCTVMFVFLVVVLGVGVVVVVVVGW